MEQLISKISSSTNRATWNTVHCRKISILNRKRERLGRSYPIHRKANNTAIERVGSKSRHTCNKVRERDLDEGVISQHTNIEDNHDVNNSCQTTKDRVSSIQKHSTAGMVGRILAILLNIK